MLYQIIATSFLENVGRLKKLEYLNLALNNVEKVENLEGIFKNCLTRVTGHHCTQHVLCTVINYK